MPPSPVALSSETVWRRGRLGLQALAGILLAVALGVAWQAPEFSIFVPLALGALIAAWWLFQRPALNLVVLLAGFVVTLNYDAGVQATELLYGLYYIAFVLHWYGTRLIVGERIVFTRVDRAAAFLALGGLIVGVALGLVFEGSLDDIRGEATAFMMLGFYFPVKELCRTERYGPEWLLAVVFGIAFFVVARYILNFREVVLAATEVWQIADARPGTNDIQLLVGGLTALVLLVHVRTWSMRLVFLVMVSLFAFGLIITKSRGYWIDFALGVFLLTFLLHGRNRWRLILLTVGGTTLLLGVAFLFFGPVAELVVSGTIKRFGTLGTAATQDVSLINRFIEYETVGEGILRNPVVGYGFGTTYTFFDIVFAFTRTGSFMHNGYLAMWFKLGIGGFVLMMITWGGAIWQGLRAFWSPKVSPAHRTYALSASLTLMALAPTIGTSNPFGLMDQMFTFTLQLGLAVGLYQRYIVPPHAQTTPEEEAVRRTPEGGEGP